MSDEGGQPEREGEPTLDELREEVEGLTEMWEAEGAEWGDRLSEAADELARREKRRGHAE